MARGVRPYDAESCYRAFAGDVALARGCRWGDYSAARADARGRIWMATEYIPDLLRTKRASWGTSVGRLARRTWQGPPPAATQAGRGSPVVTSFAAPGALRPP